MSVLDEQKLLVFEKRISGLVEENQQLKARETSYLTALADLEEEKQQLQTEITYLKTKLAKS